MTKNKPMIYENKLLSYDRTGELIDYNKFKELICSEYSIIKRDMVGPFLVSTIWLGIDHNFGSVDGKKPIIFETMVFEPPSAHDLHMERYSNEEEAIEGHEKMCELVREKKLNFK
jgi:hypothetical protein